MKRLAFLLLLSGTGSAFAADVVVANQYASVPYAPASGLNTLIRDVGAARTAQLIIGQSQLGGMNVGDKITGISFRLWNGATSTFTGANWASYDIRIGQSVAVASATTTFASNFTGSTTLVQTGALTMSGFTSGNTGSTPNAWCNVINFQSQYTYTGGPLCIEFRHTGSDITNPANTFLEAVATTGLGYGTDYRSFTGTGNTATVGAAATFTMARLTYTAVPEPATMVALGLGAAALIRRRRK